MRQNDVRTVCGRRLKNKDLLSMSDPMCVVAQRNQEGIFKEVGRTEVKQNDLNPRCVPRTSVPDPQQG